nr:prolyl endopeptidase-like isoform X2 [Tanacetum cinerariifolium]
MGSLSSVGETLNYPSFMRDESLVDTYHGVSVPDPYRWLEDPDSEEVKEFVEKQVELTESVLKKCETREKLHDKLTKFYDYPKFGAPFREADKYFYFHNSGLQPQKVMYMQDSLDGKAEVLLDPNGLSEDGTVALSTYAVSEDAKYLAYALLHASRPDLFGCSLAHVGVMDMLRFHKFTIGHAWTSDYGCSDKEEEFQWLIKLWYLGYRVFVPSKDGTKIPMFVVARKDIVLDGSHPCLLYGYGGFNISLTPYFSVSRIVLMRHLGVVFCLANIRGGGEYGEEWHKDGSLAKKQNCFDDFISSAEYLVSSGYTQPKKLAIEGGSNGGLLVGACTNQRPDLFGHAWTSDYGCSDKEEEFQWLIKYSPLHNVRRPWEQSNDRSSQYPPTLLLTADHDDRVVPLHTLKLLAVCGSNGGLLVGACTNQRPDLFGCSLAHVGVMDMLRFHKFTIGHAWTSDYGCSDKEEEFQWLIKYSPLHNVRRPWEQSNDRSSQYPPTLLLTADHDDRVVPLHTLKLLATMQYVLCTSLDNSPQTNPILGRIDCKAGHGSGRPTKKVIDEWADSYSFMAKVVGANWID